MTHHVPKIAIVSYNPIPPYASGIMTLQGTEIFVASEIFNPKSIASVTPDDVLFQELLRYLKTLERIFIFAGKKSSGGVALIMLFAAHFASKKHVLHFVLCDHDKEEKIACLESLGFAPEHYMTFSDNHAQCQEGVLLKGLMLDYLEKR